MLLWTPVGGSRKVGRPLSRWTDDIDRFAGARLGTLPGDWTMLAFDRVGWESWAEDFATASD